MIFAKYHDILLSGTDRVAHRELDSGAVRVAQCAAAGRPERHADAGSDKPDRLF